MKYLLDTNILIYLLKKGNKRIFANIAQKDFGQLSVSSITLAELEFGARNSSKPDLNRSVFLGVLASINVIPFDDNCAFEYGIIRKYLKDNGTPIGPMDMLIAATALANDMVMVTNNVSEFKRVQNLRVEDWTKS